MQKNLHIFLLKSVSKFLLGLLKFTRLLRTNEEKKNRKFSAIGYTLQLFKVIGKTAANPGETFTQSTVQKNMSVAGGGGGSGGVALI